MCLLSTQDNRQHRMPNVVYIYIYINIFAEQNTPDITEEHRRQEYLANTTAFAFQRRGQRLARDAWTQVSTDTCIEGRPLLNLG